MPFEVEMKFPLADPAAIRRRLEQWGAEEKPPIEQRDIYLSHPSRDFALTDEALRIRISAGRNVITYKGPLVDAVTKTRREIEIPIGNTDSDVEQWRELLEQLGFRAVHEVRKVRVPYAVEWKGRSFEVAVDDVAGLGMFLEIETIAAESDREAATAALLQFAAEFDLQPTERRSYLRLLLDAGEQSPTGPR